MKITVLGDIHGRQQWRKIIENEIDSDLFIFLGDYVTTHESIPAEIQICNLTDILAFKEQNSDKVILLRGNHDLQMMGYYWAECSGYDRNVARWFNNTENFERFKNLTQWIYIDDNIKTVFSHAGISSVWLSETCDNIDIHKINNLDITEKFGFIPGNFTDYTGDSTTQPPVWIRPMALIRCMIPDYNQVVGHTPLDDITNLKSFLEKKVKYSINNDLWLCDTALKSYLVIDNGNFIPKKLI